MDDDILSSISSSRGGQTLCSVVLEHAAARPETTFIEVWDQEAGVTLSVTFRELSDCMLAAASWLGGLGVGAGDYCALLAHNSVAFLAITFGAMARGATSIHLNWRNPRDINTVLVRDLDARLLVASKPFQHDAQAIHAAVGTRLMLIESVCNAADELPFAALPEAQAAELADEVQRLSADRTAVVFFTGGTTGTPKAVPHSHSGLIWMAEALVRAHPTAVKPRPRPGARQVTMVNAGTICFTPFFHVMGFSANLIYNLVAGVRAAVLASHDARLSPALILAATEELKPAVVNTVPWVVEGLVAMLSSGEHPTAGATLAELHHMTYGGAALPSHCMPVLRSHGISVACTYGQTELAGPCMNGMINGDPNALRPFEGTSYELVRGSDVCQRRRSKPNQRRSHTNVQHAN